MSDVDNDHDRETDEWIVPDDLRPHAIPSSSNPRGGPALTRRGFLGALAGLRRDGGEPS